MKPQRSYIARQVSFIVAASFLLGGSSQSATTEIATSPLGVASPGAVKPNLLFVLDDSGSMDFDYLPDYVNDSLCRQTGAGISSTNYSGTFGRACCEDASSSSACLTGSPPFSTYRGHPLFLAAEFNGVAYNPAIRYLPPVNADGTERANMTAAATSTWTSVKVDAFGIQSPYNINLVTGYPDTLWCPSATSLDSECLRNDNYVLPGTVGGVNYSTYRATVASGTGKVASGAPDNATTSSRDIGPHYYRIIASEYCDSVSLRNCSSSASGSFTYPAAVRWCNSDANARAASPAANTCQAIRNATFNYARFPTKYGTSGTAGVPATPGTPASTPNITFSTAGCTATKKVSVGPINVATPSGTVDILAGATTAAAQDATGLRDAIAAAINASAVGYKATTSGTARLKITAIVGAGNVTSAPVFVRTAGSSAACTFASGTPTPSFSGYVAPTPYIPPTGATFGGGFERIDIVPSRTSYPKAAARTDCGGATCTYDEEMTNFANWFTYYHSRMQTMKTSVSRAFSAIGNNRRLSYMSINNATGSDFLNMGVFEGAQKTNWFAKLFNAKPNSSTPLRTALSKAGRLYGGRLNGTALNGSIVTDPMEYSCQKNYTILSTDGFWNESTNPKQLDGSTEIGDQDSSLDRPMKDGLSTGNTLADTASYYFLTDLRHDATLGASPPAYCSVLSGSPLATHDLCGNSTSPTTVPHEVQNMRTFTLGLGVSGNMQFRPDYLTAGAGSDFYAVREGLTASPGTGVCTWQASGECNWPQPVSNTLTAVDDLWHAAVNGGGTYFSAGDPSALYTGLYNALQAISVQIGTAAAATTSNPNISAGDNQVFVSTYKSAYWFGELVSQRIDPTTGLIDESTSDWSAQALLDANTSRQIFMFSAGAPTKLKAFSYAAMSATEKGYFAKTYISSGASALSQFCTFGPYCLPSATQDAAAGDPLVQFLAGDRTNEGDLSDTTKYYRARSHVLGDIVSSEAVFVRGSKVSYPAADFITFASSISSRTPMIYVGANDGMLHAFNATTGAEVWAYVPSAVLPNMYKLADKDYATKHSYYVNSTPVVADIKIGGSWRTILVGGLGAGGRAYYALDVTDPSAPTALWEFTDSNLGLTFGRPEIGLLESGAWAVFLPSGYNNVSPGDGVGRLFVLDAATGTIIRTISDATGDTTTPSNLGHIRAWVDNADVDGTVKRVYGADNLGNVWRFDVNNNVGASGYDAQRLATLKSATGVIQPVTSRPELGQIGSNPMVYVGTGRYMGMTDLADTNIGSIYGIKDRLTNEDFGNPRTPANSFVKQTLSTSTCPAGASSTCAATEAVRIVASPLPVNLASDGGWYVDLLESSERVTTDPLLTLGTLIVNSNVIITGNVCKAGGKSWENFIDYKTGATLSVQLGDSLATSPSVLMTTTGKLVVLSRMEGTGLTVEKGYDPTLGAGHTRRLSWRDLVRDM